MYYRLQTLLRLGILLLAGGLLPTGQAAALSLGDLVVHSRPGKPLRASITLTLEGEERLDQLHITLAPSELYQQQHLERPPFLDGLQIALLAKDESNAKIQLFGTRPWQGEEAELLLLASWPQGQLSQRFHLARVGLTSGGEVATPLFVEVAENETLDAIAIRLSEGRNRSYLHMMYALYLANPDAFYRGNMNNLKGGARLRVPTEEELYRLSDAEVFGAIRRQYRQWLEQRGHASQTTGRAGAALATMSDAQAAALDLKGGAPALQRQLQKLAAENEAIQRRNEELKARLARLEQQMQQVTEQVLEYPAAAEPGAEPTSPADVAKGASVAGAADEKASAAGLPAWVILIAMAMVAGAGVLLHRYMSGRREMGE